MGRVHSPKGQVVLNKGHKLKAVAAQLSPEASDDDFAAKFKELYPEDWDRIVSRYRKHERVNKGKPHPMPNPEKYLLSMVKTHRAKAAADFVRPDPASIPQGPDDPGVA